MTTKHDQGKLRYHLLPAKALRLVVDVLTRGAVKYEEENWRTVKDWRKRYTSAAMRHLEAYRMGERADPEWGLPHLAHLACCVLFLLELEEHPTQVAFRQAADKVEESLGPPPGFEHIGPPPCVWGEATAKSQGYRQEIKEGPTGGPYRTAPSSGCLCRPVPGVPQWVTTVPECPFHGSKYRVEGMFQEATGDWLDQIGDYMVGLKRPKDPQGKPFSDREYRKAIADLLTMRHG